MPEHQHFGSSKQQVTFRELRSRRLRRERFTQLSNRLNQSLHQQFGSLKCGPTFQDFIAEALCCFYEQCRRKRAFADNDRPVFPYLLSTAQRVGFASLNREGKTNYEKARRLECSSTDSEIAFESELLAEEPEGSSLGELRVSPDFKWAWEKLSISQQFVLEAHANALASDFDLRADALAAELGATNNSDAISVSAVRQHKSRGLKFIRKEILKTQKLVMIEHEKTK